MNNLDSIGYENNTIDTISVIETKIIGKNHEILIISVLSFLIRFFVAINTGGFVHGDEIFQSLEIAHKMAFGNGFVTWEWELGVRSYFYPLVFYAIFKGCDILGLNYITQTLFVVKLFNVFISFLVPPTIYLIALELYKNRRIAFMAGLLCCFWHELLYYGMRSLSNSFAMPFIFLSVLFFFQATRENLDKNDVKNLQITRRTITRGFFSGVMCGIAFMTRIDSLLFVLPIVVWGLFMSKRRVKVVTAFFIVGLSCMVLFQGILDLLFYDRFLWSPLAFFEFQSYNVEYQIARFGPTRSRIWYFSELWSSMTLLMSFFLISLIFSVTYSLYEILSTNKSNKTKTILPTVNKKQLIVSDWILFSLIIFPLLGFSFAPHKEIRYILSLIPWFLLFVTRGAMLANHSLSQGIGYIWAKLEMKIPKKYKFHVKEIVYFPIIILIFVSLIGESTINSLNAWWSPHQDLLQSMSWVGQQDDATGVIILPYAFYETGGYTYLHKDIPMRFSLIHVRQKEYNYIIISLETFEENNEWKAYILDHGFQIIRLTKEHAILNRG